MKSCLAPAKINLALHVTGQRDDGYHVLDTLVTFTAPTFRAACDEVRMERAQTDSLHITGPEAGGLTAEADNLILQAIQALRCHGYEIPRMRIELIKNLPVASGIGGGSADAAAALHLANSFLEQPADQDTLHKVGSELGADVPMCLVGQPLRARGIGDALIEVVAPGMPMVLVNPRVGVSTPSVFKALANKDNAPMATLPGPTGNWTAWLGEQRNDLEPAAISLCPQIETVLSALRSSFRVQLARMSGSGATCFGLYATKDDADAAARDLAQAYPDWWVVALETAPTAALPMEAAQ